MERPDALDLVVAAPGRVHVGEQDFELDLLFYHRDLQCLVAFDLKAVRFEPEQMAKCTSI
jgi:predicted nuclease of restriction endonuclease-like (RecB) superfamily